MNNLSFDLILQESQGPPSPEDVHISYLPLAHMMERVAHVRCITLMITSP